MSADEQSGDSHHHGDEEHAGADAFDHTAQRLCRTQTFSHQRASHFARPHSEHVKHAGLDEASECVRCFVLTSLGDHRQRQERVGEQRRAVGDGEVASVVIKQLSERSDAEPADRTQGTLHFSIAELIFQSNIKSVCSSTSCEEVGFCSPESRLSGHIVYFRSFYILMKFPSTNL